jgi:hypothetical protein
VGWGGSQEGEIMGAMYIIYSISLIGIVTMNPHLYNEYILIKIITKRKQMDKFLDTLPAKIEQRRYKIT